MLHECERGCLLELGGLPECGVCEYLRPLLREGAHILEDLVGLEWEEAEEHDVALGHDALVVEVHVHAEVLLEGSQKVRLPGRHIQTQVGDLSLHFYQLCQYHGADLAATDNAHLVWNSAGGITSTALLMYGDLASL